MRYRVLLSLEIESVDPNQAIESAIKLEGLMKNPMVKMAIEGEGIRLSGDGKPIVYSPQRL